MIIFLSPYGNQRLVPTDTSSTLSYLQVIEYPEINPYVELEREALETTGHMRPKERRALTSPNTWCAYLSPTGGDEKSLHRVALFNLTQLVELAESLHWKPHRRLGPVVALGLTATIWVGLFMNQVQEQCFEGFLALRHSDIWKGTLCFSTCESGFIFCSFTLRNLKVIFIAVEKKQRRAVGIFPWYIGRPRNL